jgi:hypothetical protein
VPVEANDATTRHLKAPVIAGDGYIGGSGSCVRRDQDAEITGERKPDQEVACVSN